MTILKVHQATFSYPRGPDVLKNLSFFVEEQSISVILGPNGSGKSTILDICLGWRSLEHGDVLLKDKPIQDWSRRERGKIVSLVPQHENIRFDFSVIEYVLLGRGPYLHPLATPGADDYVGATEALDSVGLVGLKDRSITTLSGGEYQLMLIARSLVQQPDLLLLDEPTSQLDPANQVLVIKQLKRLAGRGMTILYTSHDPGAASLIADTFHLLKGGSFVYSGSAKHVLTKAKLLDVYGVSFSIDWGGEYPRFSWDLNGE